MASANPANVKRRKRRDVQRNVRDLNFLIMEDESEEEVFPEAVDVGLNAEGYDRDPEAELVHNAVVLETVESTENFEDDCLDTNDSNTGVSSASVSGNSSICDFEELNHDSDWLEEALGGDQSLKKQLASWALVCDVKQHQVDSLLKILRTQPGLEYLPSTCRTLVKTPRDVVLTEMFPGFYFHFGLEKGIVNAL